MIETFLVALFSLLIAHYLQARKAAREIRRNREEMVSRPSHAMVLKSRN